MRTSLTIPDETLAEFDRTWQAEGLDSRSRAVREAIQEYVESHHTVERARGTVAATIVFDYVHDEVIEDLHEIQHEFQSVIDTNCHVHHGEWCLEAIFCHGAAEEIRSLVYRLKDFDAVSRVSVTLLRSDGEY
ncbi:CopG family ribbon-helix-helix protein [Natronobacterium gregoryi]|uniref:CopG family transcriptional regulator n=2 Tax=Natronobacterium gregoryi TaxID=44930 RepID=L0AF32_NATGS|nr:ribbon-helix-helix protein, CopG family [Natronobacterium gregoryi]AFZ71650.1 putative transcriptional regulator with CopG/Arc/MetJ DNA-binding domain and metal-binding domain [Natronobacterium gregoryi SP2]ELY66269.1 CopG family transcriptional regulator [Natronobacterium gregoryi SP2]PLK18749.1 ribbon-helix-helix protein, CopG family [Natronobacterium gregoryi SP2]SFJ65215.1 CopG family transcriptional regulator, nickel-responsive regulator [Natronobacterium gregoryi]